MNRKLLLFVFGMFALLAFSAIGSAYNYYGGVYGSYGQGYQDDFDRTTYHVTRTSGNGPFVTTKDTFYDRTSEDYWNGREWVERTTYVKETREDPGYYSGSRYRRGFNDYGRGYYLGGYGNTRNNPWYRNYWGEDDRFRYGYQGYEPYRYRYRY